MKSQLPLPVAQRMNVLQAEGAYSVLSQATALERTGKKIIHLEIGQPDFETPPHITQSGVDALYRGKTKYTPPLGIFEFREQIAKMITETRRVNTTVNQIAVTPSAKTAIFLALSALIEKGDEVLYPDPGFPTYATLIDFFGGKRKPIPLLESRGFSFDMKLLKASITKKTKLIILNSPSNPTGGVLPQKDLAEIASLAIQHNFWVITDEIYRDIVYGDLQWKSIYSLEGMKKRTIIVDGFSKTYAMTGWRLGFMVVPEEIIEKIDYLLTHTVGCTASFTQEAGITALTGPKTPIITMVTEFKKRRDYLVSALNSIPGVSCSMPNGAFYVFPNITSFNRSSKDIASYLLHTAGVALLDGTSFGMNGEGYLRISYATSMKKLEEGIGNIQKALKLLV